MLTDSFQEECIVIEIVLHKGHLPLALRTGSLDHNI